MYIFQYLNFFFIIYLKYFLQVIQKGGTGTPTKPKGRPKKDSPTNSPGSNDTQNDMSIGTDTSVTNNYNVNYSQFDSQRSNIT